MEMDLLKQIWHVDDFDWEFKSLADSKITVEGKQLLLSTLPFTGKSKWKSYCFPFDNKIKTILKYKYM
jgi:hypothetical protein